jgi:hypothetical protein
MEEDVKPEDEDGVDGRGVSGWDEWVCGLGAVSTSLAFGLVRGSGAFAVVLPSFALSSRMSEKQEFLKLKNRNETEKQEFFFSPKILVTDYIHVGIPRRHDNTTYQP